MPAIIAVLLVISALIIFSVQNAAPVAVTFLAWKFQASLTIIIFLSLIIGIFVGVIMTSFKMLRRPGKDKKQDDVKSA